MSSYRDCLRTELCAWLPAGQICAIVFQYPTAQQRRSPTGRSRESVPRVIEIHDFPAPCRPGEAPLDCQEKGLPRPSPVFRPGEDLAIGRYRALLRT